MSKMIRIVLEFIFSFFPLANIILFESSPDFSDNAEAFYKYLVKRNVNKKYKLIWILNNEDSTYPLSDNCSCIYRNSTSIFQRFYLIYIHQCAKYIFDSNSYVHKAKKKQMRIHLGHGMPIKMPRQYCAASGKLDYIVVNGDFFKDIYCDLYHVTPDQVINTGLPRNDYLRKDVENTLYLGKKLIFWMPTYRQHKSGNQDVSMKDSLLFGLPCIESKEQLSKINEVVKENNAILLFRLHPAQDISNIHFEEYDSIVNADDDYLKRNHFTLYELLNISDALITDYSSVYYDYLLKECPIGLTIDDLDAYKDKFELAFDYKTHIKGYYITNFSDLVNFINDMDCRDIKEMKTVYFDDPSSSSCEKLYDFIEKVKPF